MEIDTNGNIKGGSGIVWHTGSDRRIKENIKTIPNALETIKSLRGVTFDFKKGMLIDRNKKQYGFIAQEVEKIIPDLVNDFAHRVVLDEEIVDDVIGVDERLGFVSILVEAVKELTLKVEALEAKENERSNH
jgi:hypothetical protein